MKPIPKLNLITGERIMGLMLKHKHLRNDVFVDVASIRRRDEWIEKLLADVDYCECGHFEAEHEGKRKCLVEACPDECKRWMPMYAEIGKARWGLRVGL